MAIFIDLKVARMQYLANIDSGCTDAIFQVFLAIFCIFISNNAVQKLPKTAIFIDLKVAKLANEHTWSIASVHPESMFAKYRIRASRVDVCSIRASGVDVC